MQKDTTYIENLIKDHLDTHSCWQAMASENPEGFGILRNAILAPGKRVRPRLFAAACRDFGVEPFPRLSAVAVALELAHSFILIHDDLIDRSSVRRGRPTLKCAADQWFKRVPADGFRGSDFALIGGDLLFSMAVDSLSQADVSDHLKQQMLDCFMTAAQRTARGAFMEMQASQTPVGELSIEWIEEIYSMKTGSYTFVLPLRLAAVCADVPPSGLEKIGRVAGIAFQLYNDLKSLHGWIETGEVPDDVRDRRRTWPLVYAGTDENLQSEQILAAVREEAGRQAGLALESIQGLPLTADFIRRAFDVG